MNRIAEIKNVLSESSDSGQDFQESQKNWI